MSQGASEDFRGTARFAVQRRLGAGGMGIVYEALDREKNVQVALKTLRTPSAEGLLRLKREFRALQDLQHPNLVSLGELIEAEGVLFFTMELVRGASFLEHVRPAERWRHEAGVSPTEETWQASPGQQLFDAAANEVRVGFDEHRLRSSLVQLVLGLDALHAGGKVHRDVKPTNILVTDDSRVVLLDFGLVVDTGGRKSWTDVNVVGTATYMAPEQAMGRAVGPAADLYSVGVLLYEALVGAPPFVGPNLQVLMEKQQREPPPPRAQIAGVPEDLEAMSLELLRFDPDQRPAARTILQRLGHTAAKPAPRSTPSSPAPAFVGRRRELAALHGAFAETRAGRGVTVYVDGESGIGKSSLVRRFTEELVSADPTVVLLAGRCYERETVRYKALDGVIDALARFLYGLPPRDVAALVPRDASLLVLAFPVLKRVAVLAEASRREGIDPQELRARLFTCLRELFARLAERYPLVVVIDDVQWADDDSLAMLAEVTRPPDASPFLLLALGWETEAEASGRALTGEVRHLAVGELSSEEARELARSLLLATGDEPGPGLDAEGIARDAGGHPLFIDELARFAAVAGDAPRATGLEQAIRGRIESLPPPAQRLLEIIAVAGAPVEQAIAADAAGIDFAELGRQAAFLRVVHLARTSGSRGVSKLEPYHDRVREAVLADLDADQLRACHHSLARALEASGNADPEALAVHHQGAGNLASAAAAAVLAASAALQVLAFERAIRMFRLALTLHPADHADARTLKIRLGAALASCGRGLEAAEVYLGAVEGGDAASRLDCRRRAAEQLLSSGHVARALEEVRGVLAEVGLTLPRSPRRALLSLLWHRAKLRTRGMSWKATDPSHISAVDQQRLEVHRAIALGLSMVDHIRGAEFHARGLLLALSTGSKLHVARSLGMEAAYLAARGTANRARAERYLAEMGRIVEETGDPYLRGWALACAGTVDHLTGHFLRARDLLAESDRNFREYTTGTSFELNHVRVSWLFALLNTGAFREVSRRVDEYVADATLRGDLFPAASLLRVSTQSFVHRDEPARAREYVEQQRWSPPETGFVHMQHWFALSSRWLLELYEGTVRDSFDRDTADRDTIGRSLLMRIQLTRSDFHWMCGRVALAQAATASDPRRLLHEASTRARLLGREDVPYAALWSLLLAGGVAAHEGKRDAAVDLLRSAIVIGEREGIAAIVAGARRCVGQLVGGDAGRSLVEAADAWMAVEDVRNPARYTNMTIPGFADADR